METVTLTPLTLDAPLEDAVGAENAARLNTLGLSTVQDLITYWPRKWRERGTDIDLALIPDGEPATVRVTIESLKETSLRNNPRRRFLTARCVTPHGRTLEASFFSPWKARQDGIKQGAEVTFSGKVKTFKGTRQMSNPEYVFDSEVGEDMAGTIVSIYPATAQATSPWIAEQITEVLDSIGTLVDPVPGYLLFDQELPGYNWAVRQVHRPDSIENAELAKKRLTYDEALAVQLSLAIRRYGSKSTPTRALPPIPNGLRVEFDRRLPFELTAGQASAGEKIATAMNSTTPANALVLGEVGSGKTVVALRAILQAVDAGAQAAFIAPTEVLATQHYEGLVKSLEGLDINIALFTGNSTKGAAARRELEADIAAGRIDLVVGTHVLTNGKTKFDNLGLVVVDEQHRFGVAARDALRRQAIPPHMVVMTATPIPRTLAMTVYGDLDVVALDGLPAGRQPIRTVVIPTMKEAWVARLWEVINEEIAAGRQAFIVASLIDAADRPADADDETVNTQWDDESETSTPALPLSVSELVEAVRVNLPHVRVGMLHGRMDAETKRVTMEQFNGGELDVLVSTTVIEVGVNVPNATVMAIWDADRFGIAQLHQLRGRVGRGEHAGLCLLVTNTPDEHSSRQRLDTVAGTLDGHKLAVADLKTRREGDILGTGQAGRSQFKLLDLTSGARLIGAARKDAEALIKADPALRGHYVLAQWLRDLIGDEAAANLARA